MGLVKILAEIFNINLDDELNQAKIFNDERAKFKNCYAYIDTNFGRTTEPILHIVMLFSSRYLSLNLKELYFQNLDTQLKIVSNYLKTHYNRTKSLPMFGAITGYNAHFLGEIYSFDTNGALKDEIISESKIWIKI